MYEGGTGVSTQSTMQNSVIASIVPALVDTDSQIVAATTAARPKATAGDRRVSSAVLRFTAVYS
ncbi:hypothetical protein GCM10028856_32220 [Halopiger thermotolerans]